MDDPVERQRQLAYFAKVRGGPEGHAAKRVHEAEAKRLSRQAASRKAKGGTR